MVVSVVVRVGKWKWVDMGNGRGGLFRLDTDIAERNDLSESKPEVLKMVRGRYEAWLNEMASSPTRGPFRDF